MKTITKTYSIANTEFDFTRTYIMGIVNITPDSFSDGGQFLNPDKALAHIEKLIQEGADIIDIGGETTKPGTTPISAKEEIARLKPVLTQYKRLFSTPLSVDTTKSDVTKFALDNGADIINDISGLAFAPQIARLIKDYHATLIVMHMQGTPQTMQIAPNYRQVVNEVKTELTKSIELAKENGVSQIIIDPGIGFGKTREHNLQLLKGLDQFLSLDYPILIGTSRKSFLGEITNSAISDRLPETLASNLWAYLVGAHIFRVHDVNAHRNALQVFQAIQNG